MEGLKVYALSSSPCTEGGRKKGRKGEREGGREEGRNERTNKRTKEREQCLVLCANCYDYY
jgi:hypothetical protein